MKILNKSLFLAMVSLLHLNGANAQNVSIGHAHNSNINIEQNARESSKQDIKNLNLIKAVENDNIDLVRHWIKQGAWVNTQRESDGSTPLIIAVASSRLDIIQLLLKHKAYINIFNTHRKNAIAYAIANNNLEITNLLLMKGENTIDKIVKSSDKHQSVSPVFYVKSPAMIDLLVSKYGKEIFKQEVRAAECYGSSYKSFESFDIYYYSYNGPEYNIKDIYPEFCSPIVWIRNTQIRQHLFKLGIYNKNISMIDFIKNAEFKSGKIDQKIEFLKDLITLSGVNSNNYLDILNSTKNEDTQSLLRFMIQNTKEKIVLEQLVQKILVMNLKTSLYWISSVVDELIDINFDIIKHQDALIQGLLEKLIVNHEIKVSDILNHLKDSGFDLSRRLEKGFSTLELAILAKQPSEVIDLLLDQNIRKDVLVTADEITFIEFHLKSIRNENRTSHVLKDIEMLLDIGFSPLGLSLKQETLLSFIAKSNYEDKHEAYSRLLEYKFDLNQRNRENLLSLNVYTALLPRDRWQGGNPRYLLKPSSLMLENVSTEFALLSDNNKAEYLKWVVAIDPNVYILAPLLVLHPKFYTKELCKQLSSFQKRAIKRVLRNSK